ncbi:MAG: orotidine-5'-phosphate decarboxylase [Gammaproteobacteria bacterium CG22_combo_CG10-13_8_21_14_all_40_8]|nr:MAG: orotidine-5'-phosphate decarboxylase [Gammaproteobacteria bacterium CG22_combo_CG10-13_8_21_14_all_40_8]
MSAIQPIIIALDYACKLDALNFVEQLDPTLCRLKIGKEMFTHFGPQFVTELQSKGFEIFLDLKFHDIPNTVAKAVAAASDLGVWMVNVHACGGIDMMKAASNALKNKPQNKTLLIAVTVLTSMSQQDLQAVGIQRTVEEQVLALAKLTYEAGLDGVVCSAKEVTLLREHLPKDFLLVTPGIRPVGSALDDQKRVLTPSEALKMGSNYLVIGRPITQSPKPSETLQQICLSL